MLNLSLPGLCNNGNEKERARQSPGLHTLAGSELLVFPQVLFLKLNFNSRLLLLLIA